MGRCSVSRRQLDVRAENKGGSVNKGELEAFVFGDQVRLEEEKEQLFWGCRLENNFFNLMSLLMPMSSRLW